MLCKHWKERKRYRGVLKDLALGEDPELFFMRCPDGEFRDDYTQLHRGKLAERVILFWLWRWYADFEETFFEEERFIKVEEGEDWHATNYERAPGSK